MKKIIVLLLLAIAGVAAWFIWETRKKPKDETPENRIAAPRKYSDNFNQSITNTLNDYYALSEAFVKWDTVAINDQALKLSAAVEKLDFSETKKDTVSMQAEIKSLNNNLQQITSSNELEAKRHAFNSFTKKFYALLNNIEYDNAVVYLQKCPMAFNDTGTGVWLSNNDEIRNPYLGLHHPKYGKGMLECGENESKLDYAKSEGNN